MAISKPEFVALKYVGGTPDTSERPDQTRIKWILNGEPTLGSTSELTSEGVLNRPVSQVQDNAVTLYVNSFHIKETVDELVDTVNELTGEAGADFGSRIQSLEAWQTTASQQITTISGQIGNDGSVEGQSKTGIYADIQHLMESVGSRASVDVQNPLVGSNSTWGELWFVKSTMIGNKKNYDPNGNYNPDEYPDASGLFAETDALRTSNSQLSGAVTQLDSRLTSLEDASEVGAVSELRTDVGERTDPDYTPDFTVYNRLGTLERTSADLSQTQTDHGDLLSSYGGRIEQVETAVGENNTTLSTHSQELSGIDQTIGIWEAARGTVAEFTLITQNDLTNLKAIVGTGAWETEPNSVRYVLNDVVVQLGDQATAAAGGGTLWGYVNTYLKNTAPGSLTHTANRVTAVEQELDLSTLTGVTDKSSLPAVLQEVVNRIQALEAV